MTDVDLYLLILCVAGAPLWCFMEEVWSPFTDNGPYGPTPW